MTKVSFTGRDLYLAVFDAHVQHRTLTVASLAVVFSTDVPTIADTIRLMRDNALVEMDESADATLAERILTCDDAERINRQTAAEKYSEVIQTWKQQQTPSAPAAVKAPAAHPSGSAHASHTASSVAGRTIVLAERKVGKGNVAMFTSAKPHMFETEAILAHRNEHAHAVPCVVSGVGYAHTTTVPIGSRAYNHMRVAVREVLHSTDSAVIRWLRGATEEQLEACVARARERMAITVTVMSARAAAKAIRASLDDNPE